MTGSFTEVLLAQETRVSALIDGEESFAENGPGVTASEVQQYYQYQLIRQTLRGAVMTSGAHETSSWSEIRFSKLWARIDGQSDDQTA